MTDTAGREDDNAAKLTDDIQRLEARAMNLNLTITTRALNQAKNACGWERAGALGHAERAAVGKRPGED